MRGYGSAAAVFLRDMIAAMRGDACHTFAATRRLLMLHSAYAITPLFSMPPCHADFRHDVTPCCYARLMRLLRAARYALCVYACQ